MSGKQLCFDGTDRREILIGMERIRTFWKAGRQPVFDFWFLGSSGGGGLNENKI